MRKPFDLFKFILISSVSLAILGGCAWMGTPKAPATSLVQMDDGSVAYIDRDVSKAHGFAEVAAFRMQEHCDTSQSGVATQITQNTGPSTDGSEEHVIVFRCE